MKTIFGIANSCDVFGAREVDCNIPFSEHFLQEAKRRNFYPIFVSSISIKRMIQMYPTRFHHEIDWNALRESMEIIPPARWSLVKSGIVPFSDREDVHTQIKLLSQIGRYNEVIIRLRLAIYLRLIEMEMGEDLFCDPIRTSTISSEGAMMACGIIAGKKIFIAGNERVDHESQGLNSVGLGITTELLAGRSR